MRERFCSRFLCCSNFLFCFKDQGVSGVAAACNIRTTKIGRWIARILLTKQKEFTVPRGRIYKNETNILLSI